MTDTSHLDQIQEDERDAPQPPSSPVAEGHAHHSSPRPSSPPVARRPARQRAHSNASHVSIDYFDPQGVDELRRTMSRLSTNTARDRAIAESGSGKQLSDASSEVTIAVGDGPFDFEKTLRAVVKK